MNKRLELVKLLEQVVKKQIKEIQSPVHITKQFDKRVTLWKDLLVQKQKMVDEFKNKMGTLKGTQKDDFKKQYVLRMKKLNDELVAAEAEAMGAVMNLEVPNVDSLGDI